MTDNVKFSISVPTYNTTYKRMVMGTTPIMEHVHGTLAELQPTLESEIISGQEKDRFIRYRLIFQRTIPLEDVLKSGAMIQITHKRHRLTNSWKVLPTTEQYIVESDTDIQLVGDSVNLGLVRKDQQ